MISLTRRYRFSASHRLNSPFLSAAENATIFGKCNNPFGHGHNYILEITVTGSVDSTTGLILPVSELDRLIDEKILRLFANRNLNLDVPQFAAIIPTTENLALVTAELLPRYWAAYLANTRAQLQRVHIAETERNSFEINLDVSEETSMSGLEPEEVAINA